MPGDYKISFSPVKRVGFETLPATLNHFQKQVIKMKRVLKSQITIGFVLTTIFFYLSTVFLEDTALAFSLPDRMGWGARAVGMGGAFTGVADDATATYYNPAGLIQIDGHVMQMGYIMQIPNISINGSLYIDKAIKGPLLSMVFDPCRPWNIKRRVRVGMSVFFPDNTKAFFKMRYGHDYDPWYPLYGDSTLQNFIASQFVAALEIFPWLYVGGGFILGVSGSEIELRMLSSDETFLQMLDGTLEFPIEAMDTRENWKFSSETRGLVGVLLKPLPKLRIGFTYRKKQLNPFEGGIPIKVDMYISSMDIVIPQEQISNFPILGAIFPLQIAVNSNFTPEQYALGASYQLRDNLLLAYDVTYYNWRNYIDDRGQFPEPQMEPVYVHRIGGEYFPVKDFAVRMGYGYEPSPLKQQNRREDAWASYVDNDIHEFGFGIGYTGYSIAKKYPVAVNVFYQFSYLVPRCVNNAHIGELPEEYRSTGEIHSFGMDMRILF